MKAVGAGGLIDPTVAAWLPNMVFLLAGLAAAGAGADVAGRLAQARPSRGVSLPRLADRPIAGALRPSDRPSLVRYISSMTPPRPVIVGTGIAGLWTAWRLASEGQAAILVTKETLADSASAWAQGGIAVALGPGDSPSQHAADTLAASDGLADPEAVRILTSEGPDRIYELLALGARFDRGPDGRLRFGLEAAHTRPRIIHAGGDRTGAALIGCLAQVVRQHPLVELLEHTEVTRLLVDDGRAVGVMALPHGSASAPILASAVVLATGGVGQLYAVTTNPKVATADGWALAHRAGARLRDLEFLQFHPDRAQAARGEPRAPHLRGGARRGGRPRGPRGATLRARRGPARASWRRVTCVARAVAAADAAGGAWLDARQVADFPARFPGITAMLARHGLDAGPGSPAGGARAPLRHGRHPDRPRGAGEPARTLGGGRGRVHRRARRQPARVQLAARGARVRRSHRALGGVHAAQPPVGAAGRGNRRRLATPATTSAASRSASRDARDHDRRCRRPANRGLPAPRRAGARPADAGEAPAGAWRTHNQLLVAGLITQAARRRRESRGGHRRADYPPAALHAGDRHDAVGSAPGHRAARRDPRRRSRRCRPRSGRWPSVATPWCWPTTISGPRCRTSPITWATRSACPARRRRRRPR